jgi:Endonuclease/Exonuclease/phosphatase family
MSKGILPAGLSVLLLLFLIPDHACSQASVIQPFRLMFYNVENMFDTTDDSLTDDNDFLPDGLMRWNSGRYYKKVNSVYKTIMAAGEWEPPPIVALCEIENRKVLEDLIYRTNLLKFNYSIIHEDSPDRRGIDVCLIFRECKADVLYYRYLIPSGIERKKFSSRSVLYLKLLLAEDTIHIFVNHWPSRRGGVLAGETARIDIASMIRDKADSINKRSKTGAKIIIIGDFNSAPDDQAIRILDNYDGTGKFLINLSDRHEDKNQGTYRYLGTWEMIDQVIVSNALLCGETGVFTQPDMLKIFKPQFLLKKDPKYPGYSPFSTYHGYKYQGGFSDHLPVLLDLTVR